ncbi:MAG: FAD binding domain-containing protein [Planctomycetota bacterium]|jgi:xanthine dehydrogenase YagS FAD-binding subunit
MKQFAFLEPESFAAASRAAIAGNTIVKGAGTDLLALMKQRIVAPDRVVGLMTIKTDEKQGEISALATLHDVATDEWVKLEFPALHTAAAEAATPQVRHAGTVGGNLAQSTRCWYFRTPGHDCLKLGSERCAAQGERAENKYHGLFAHGGCSAAHASNLAPALIAVGAQVDCVHPDGDRSMDVGLLYDGVKKGRIADTCLRPGEIIRAVRLAPSALARNSVYIELRERQSFDFAMVSVAAAAEIRDGKVAAIRVVCGGIAPMPMRLVAVEKKLTGKALDPAAAELAADGAEPLAQNRYKVPILKRLVRRALEELAR